MALQRLVVKIGVAAKVPNEALRRALTDWYTARHGEGGEAELPSRHAAIPTAEALLDSRGTAASAESADPEKSPAVGPTFKKAVVLLDSAGKVCVRVAHCVVPI